MADTYELETRDGMAKLEFDPDAFQRRDVRVLVNGSTVATILFPDEAGPHQETAFELSGQPLVAVAQVAVEGGPVDSLGLRFDLFSNGYSLLDGSTLEAARLRALNPVGRYPGSFRAIDAIIRIAPAAAVPGIVLGVTRSGDGTNDTETTVALLIAFIGATVLGTALAAKVWSWIRSRRSMRVATRAGVGLASVLASYGALWIVAIAVIVGLMNAGFIGQSAICDDAMAAASADGGTGRPTGGPLLLSDPGPDFTLVAYGPLTMEQAAASRVDPESLSQLKEAGFKTADVREWLREDGTGLRNDVFSFDTPDGAEEFNVAVASYACQYSSEMFPVPGGGVGLRILYGSGDPVRDQVAWTDGTRRVVIALGFKDDSADHHEILDLVEQARGGTAAP